MMSLPNYYARLEVSPSATLAQIKKSYRRLVRIHHPDMTGQAQDTRMKQLNEAYAVLSDAARRAAYDDLRRKATRASQVADAIRAEQAKAAHQPHMTWAEGAVGFVRELKKELPDDAQKRDAEKMTWAEGIVGFVRELKKEAK